MESKVGRTKKSYTRRYEVYWSTQSKGGGLTPTVESSVYTCNSLVEAVAFIRAQQFGKEPFTIDQVVQREVYLESWSSRQFRKDYL